MLDFELNTQVALFADEKTLEAAKRRSYQSGVLEGKDMAKVFAWMRPNDLIWNYWVQQLPARQPAAGVRHLYWNNDTTRLPAALHGEFVELFEEQPAEPPRRPGGLPARPLKRRHEKRREVTDRIRSHGSMHRS